MIGKLGIEDAGGEKAKGTVCKEMRLEMYADGWFVAGDGSETITAWWNRTRSLHKRG